MKRLAGKTAVITGLHQVSEKLLHRLLRKTVPEYISAILTRIL
jgi:hypothetical protein